MRAAMRAVALHAPLHASRGHAAKACGSFNCATTICGSHLMLCYVQIKMISDPQQIGGRPVPSAAAAGAPSSLEKGSILDMFGCTTRR